MIVQRLPQRAAHALDGQMEDDVASRHRCLYRRRVEDRAFRDPHVAPALRLAQIGPRASREVVENGDRPVLGHEMVDEVAADEPGPAGDQAAAHHSAASRSAVVVRRLASSEDCARSSMSMIRNPLRPSMIERSRPVITLPKWATTSASGSQSDTRGA